MNAAKWITASALLLLIGIPHVSANAHPRPKGADRLAIAPDIQPTALWDGRRAVDFHAVSFPTMVRAADAHFLIDDEYVLGITENGESRAYPTRFASWHHIINDRIGNREHGGSTYVTVTYCIVCNSGMRFDTPIVDNKPLNFDFYGLYNGVMTMYDSNTKSVWLQVSGRAVKGPLLDTTLKSGAVLDTTWGQWKKLHPDTLVMAPNPRNAADYEPKGSVMARGYDSFPANYFNKTVTHHDSRLPMFESVFAVSLLSAESSTSPEPSRSVQRAYPLKAFKHKTGVINDSMAATPIAVLFLGKSETMAAYSRTVGGRTLTLEARKGPDARDAFYDRETGTRWNVEGRATEGPLAGEVLPRLDSHMSQWYGWVSYFPHTSIYGQKEPIRVTARGARSE